MSKGNSTSNSYNKGTSASYSAYTTQINSIIVTDAWCNVAMILMSGYLSCDPL